MDHTRPQDAHQSQASSTWHWDFCSDEPVDKKPSDTFVSPAQGEKRPIRRVRSPSRPRAWLSNSYKPKFGGRFHRPSFPRNDHSSHEPGFGNRKNDRFSPRRAHWDLRDHFQPKLHHNALRDKETGRHERRGSAGGCSPAKQNSTSRPFVPRSTSSRDKDTQFAVCQNDRKQSGSRERDHRGTKSKEREGSRDRLLPLTASQTTTRDRAIQQKRREIDEVYYQECEMFGLVTKMLIEKDPSLEHLIQSSLQENLRDIGKRCVEAMEKFIKDYDSRELSH